MFITLLVMTWLFFCNTDPIMTCLFPCVDFSTFISLLEMTWLLFSKTYLNSLQDNVIIVWATCFTNLGGNTRISTRKIHMPWRERFLVPLHGGIAQLSIDACWRRISRHFLLTTKNMIHHESCFRLLACLDGTPFVHDHVSTL